MGGEWLRYRDQPGSTARAAHPHSTTVAGQRASRREPRTASRRFQIRSCVAMSQPRRATHQPSGSTAVRCAAGRRPAHALVGRVARRADPRLGRRREQGRSASTSGSGCSGRRRVVTGLVVRGPGGVRDVRNGGHARRARPCRVRRRRLRGQPTALARRTRQRGARRRRRAGQLAGLEDRRPRLPEHCTGDVGGADRYRDTSDKDRCRVVLAMTFDNETEPHGEGPNSSSCSGLESEASSGSSWPGRSSSPARYSESRSACRLASARRGAQAQNERAPITARGGPARPGSRASRPRSSGRRTACAGNRSDRTACRP
jgi:hypothetical protein